MYASRDPSLALRFRYLGVGAVLRRLSEAVVFELFYCDEVLYEGFLDAHGDEVDPKLE